MIIPEFNNELEQIKWLSENHKLLISYKKSESKKTDAVGFGIQSFVIDVKGERLKAEDIVSQPMYESGVINVRCIINATNILDSHKDVHFPNIWKKHLSERKDLLYLLQEHDFSFKGVISDEVKAFTQKYSFKDLGYEYDGDTECLVFDCIVRKSRNEYMFEQYVKGFVRNHSVRMIYVKMLFCLNSDNPEDSQLLDNYNKYAPLIANQEALQKCNWFYAVTEAKIADEGSAVVRGSCFTTPTISVTESKDIIQADESLEINEPLEDTQKPDNSQKIRKMFNL